ncbi:hypothetical protein AJ79_09312 [Helicocarpus griseus UAMH5409]|uniref:Uncharacterized protein n=1 Tax=Helicocarpus griseus UAMH5409 TaxID=1447875 RepID=A0A2B7WK91_9EURO|nr:hypothetical protein AJ79_09312 [Helicocarpus griseus UAMH5409]
MPEDKGIQQSVESEGFQALTQEAVATTRQWDISQAVDAAIADHAAEELRRSPASSPAQSQGPEPYFPFRTLEKMPAARNVVNAWMTNESNIERVARKFKTDIASQPTGLLSEWYPIIINSMPRPGTLRGIAPDKKKVAVIVAVGKLSPSNGLFLGEDIEMDSGQDVVFGGGEPITFPGSGGGLAILLLLNV